MVRDCAEIARRLTKVFCVPGGDYHQAVQLSLATTLRFVLDFKLHRVHRAARILISPLSPPEITAPPRSIPAMPACRSSTFALAIALSALFAARVLAAEPLTFEEHIRPILKAHCFQCHGEEGKHEGNLDVRQVRLLSKGGDGGPAIVAGRASDSLLVQ